MTDRLNGCRLDPTTRNRVLEALKTLTDALDQSAADHSYAAADNLWEAADGALRAVARLTLELRAA
jgi:hypothetical protein